uniref:hypothetical protein n=1 Tax=Olsenella uli TaxID=133926 RepID=UPI0028EAE942|nr:hypothetical protein [Olsenella uli]
MAANGQSEDSKSYEEFGREFISYYCEEQPFGSASKRNTDVEIIRLLRKHRLIDFDSAAGQYKAALKLKITEARLRNLLFEVKITEEDSDIRVREDFCTLLVRSWVNKPDKRPDTGMMPNLVVDDALLRQYIGMWASMTAEVVDSSFNSRVLKMSKDGCARLLLTAFGCPDLRTIERDDQRAKEYNNAVRALLAGLRDSKEKSDFGSSAAAISGAETKPVKKHAAALGCIFGKRLNTGERPIEEDLLKALRDFGFPVEDSDFSGLSMLKLMQGLTGIAEQLPSAVGFSPIPGISISIGEIAGLLNKAVELGMDLRKS